MRLSLTLLHDVTDKPLLEWSEDDVREMIRSEIVPWYISRTLLLKAWDQIVLKIKAESIKIA